MWMKLGCVSWHQYLIDRTVALKRQDAKKPMDSLREGARTCFFGFCSYPSFSVPVIHHLLVSSIELLIEDED